MPARGGNSTNVVGCGDFNLSKPQEIYVFEGKEEPKVEPAAGYQQTKWLNNIDPSYAENAHHPWLTVFGDLKPSYWHVHLDNPCPKAVYVGGKDVKGLGQTRISVDPKRDNDFFGDKPPVYFYFSRDIRGADKPMFDLPAGSYELKVKEDCSEVEVKEAKYPEGASKEWKKLSTASYLLGGLLARLGRFRRGAAGDELGLGHAPLAALRRHQALAQHAAQGGGETGAHRGPAVRLPQADQAADGGRRAGGDDAGQHQPAGLGGAERQLTGFAIADVADQQHVDVLARQPRAGRRRSSGHPARPRAARRRCAGP